MRSLSICIVVGALAFLQAWGCSSEQDDPTTTSTQSTATQTSSAGGSGGATGSGGGGASSGLVTPELPATPGDHSLEVGWEGADRTVIVHLPKNYDALASHPLVLVLHGGNGSAPAYHQKKKALVDAADSADVVIVFPEGTTDNGTNHVWNSWQKATTTADDVGFLDALISWLVDGLSLDSKRVFMSGFSNGAAMTQRFAAEKPEVLAAGAAVCHSTGMIEPDQQTMLKLCGDCTEVCDPKCVQVNDGLRYDIPTPKAPFNIFVIRGGQDKKVCPALGCSEKGKIVDSVETQVLFWLTANGCDKNKVDEQTQGSITLRKFDTCADGKVLHVAYDTDLGHTWADKLDDRVLSFFMAAK